MVPAIYTIELDHETDGRWLAEVAELPGTAAYGPTQDDAIARVQALALRVMADRIDHNEFGHRLISISFGAA
jgi:predicted RNase H-like HicB family nuclease